MGTVLSISPTLGREPILDPMDEGSRRSLIKPRTMVSALTFKLIKHKTAVKVNPVLPKTNQTCENGKQYVNKTKALVTPPAPSTNHERVPDTKQLGPVQKQPSRQLLASPIRVIVQASTSELLLCLGNFIRHRCLRIQNLTPDEVIAWFRNVDRTLLQQGWQEQGFITPPTLVFVYLLCRKTISKDIERPDELQGVFLTCLYLTYSYLGNEISYPLNPFIIETNKDVFWQQALDVIDKLSAEMLRINMDPQFFSEVFQELKMEGELKRDVNEVER